MFDVVMATLVFTGFFGMIGVMHLDPDRKSYGKWALPFLYGVSITATVLWFIITYTVR